MAQFPRVHLRDHHRRQLLDGRQPGHSAAHRGERPAVQGDPEREQLRPRQVRLQRVPAGVRRRRGPHELRPPGPAGAHRRPDPKVAGGLPGGRRRQERESRSRSPDVCGAARATTGSCRGSPTPTTSSRTSPGSDSTTAKSMDALKLYKDPEPYFRGFVSEIGFKRAEVEFVQPPRKHGQSKHDFFTLYGVAMTGFVNHSKLPLRLATFSGFCLAGGSLFVALRLPGLQAAVLEHVRAGSRSAGHRPVLLLRRPADLHRHHRRVRRGHSHPGQEPSARHRGREDQLR